ncbi:hypothetical protein FHR83_006790 [Actinoplanes campanulatus]|uniref:Uncharacterized protein n=1 Tax=Actinoplanes campanulatus TaxID=113559 RepID=A0A7W5FHX3_9ACTN|nr:hypothetical protein [Actinoplanes campanulatus]GGN39115.1 hypothetical protein GCM10010109_66680 [Actinoplanes campanulatus]GID40241.1 hypothetical protein Aca09nite_67470 [Actinoplanes campanulatus]
MGDETPALTVVGMGLFPLPGEKKRRQRAVAEARELLRQVAEIEQRSSGHTRVEGEQ